MMPARRSGESGLWRPLMWGTIAGLLAAPAVAMQFTHAAAWGPEDFAAAALLLVGGGLLFELALRVTSNRGARIAIGVGLVLLVALIWAEGAVGILD